MKRPTLHITVHMIRPVANIGILQSKLTYTSKIKLIVIKHRLPAEFDPEVLLTREIEYWAVVFKPVGSFNSPLPLVLFYHGNRRTCYISFLNNEW